MLGSPTEVWAAYKGPCCGAAQRERSWPGWWEAKARVREPRREGSFDQNPVPYF